MYRELRTRVINYILKNGLITPNDKLILAVSGGMDSMFLLHLMKDVQSELNIELAIGHINHNIRTDSLSDEKFVVEQATRLDIPIYIKQLEFNKDSVKNIEAWARKNRYLRLEEFRSEQKFNKIATAHHENDQIETILQRLSEKSGISGLRGIHKQIGNIIRPLLAISRKEIEAAVKELDIQYIEDETNKDEKLKRNYFRHQIVPNWEKIYPDLGDAFQIVTKNVKEHLSVLDYFFRQLEESVVLANDRDGIKLDIKQFDNLPINVRCSFVRHVLDDGEWRKHQWSELKRILLNAQLGKIYAFNDFELLKDRKEWIIRPKLMVNQKLFNIEVGQIVKVNNCSVSIIEVEKPVINDNPNVEYIDLEKVNNKNMSIRYWQEGDVFQPLGMEGTKKISNYLIDEKVNTFEKQKQLVLTANDEIVWLCGHRLSEKFKIDDDTKHYLELSIRSNVG